MDIVFISMPFVDLYRPSLGLSLLKSILARDGVESRILYGSLTLARSIGLRDYSWITDSNRFWSHVMLGEYVYAGTAFPDRAPNESAMLDLLFQYSTLSGEPLTRARASSLGRIRRLERSAREHVEEMAHRVLELEPRLVGCTSTFQQHVGSLALLRRIRELRPEVVTVMGGANCETQMGVATHRNFPWVDYLVSGDGDGLIVDLCRSVLAGGEPPRGVLTPEHRTNGYPLPVPRATFRALDDLPTPDFEDYFAQLDSEGLQQQVRVGLPVETSRGCWWGAISHCTFCGLNGGSMGFSSKKPEQVVQELDELAGRWGVTSFEVVDNILDMDYFQSVVPKLSERDWNVFYETKSNLKRAQVEALAKAGIRWIQPGIEALDTRVLALMKKGARGVAQVNLLKWARTYGVQLSYNLLWDFPGEEDAWYQETAEMLALLHHLQPPVSMTNIRFDRYSPYFRNKEELEFELKPHPLSQHVYPLPSDQIAELAYHFYRVPLVTAGPGVQALQQGVHEWNQAFPTSTLILEGHTVRDTRPCAPTPMRRLTPAEIELLERCAEGLVARSLESDSRQLAEELVESKLILKIDGRYLSLPLPPISPEYPYKPEFPGGEVYPDLFEHIYRPAAFQS
jgi:ribosomal peptide maturation radical SAM protein 1